MVLLVQQLLVFLLCLVFLEDLEDLEDLEFLEAVFWQREPTTSPPKFDRFESQQTDSHRQSLISLVSMPQYNALHPKPKKAVFALHAAVLHAAAPNQEQSLSQLIIDIGKLRTSEAGSKQDKKELRKYVLSEKGNSLPLILAALFPI